MLRQFARFTTKVLAAKPAPLVPSRTQNTSHYLLSQLNRQTSAVARRLPRMEPDRRYFSSKTGSTDQPTHHPFRSLHRNLSNLAIFALFGGLGYLLYKSNVKADVNDEAITDPHLAIIDSDQLTSAGDINLTGRSGVRKVYLINEQGEREYFYHKVTFSRRTLLNELVIGNLGRTLMNDEFPRIFAVQSRSDSNTAKFSLISESLSGNLHHDNLESWAYDYSHDEEEIKFGPQHLGKAVAFDMLFGKSDCKLANLIVRRGTGRCYSVDHESAFTLEPAFLLDESDAVESIAEFKGKQLPEHVVESLGHDMNTDDNPHQPIKNNNALKTKIKPTLKRAIKADIENGEIISLYQKFAALTPQELEAVFEPYGKLIHADEKDIFMRRLLSAQEKTRQFLAENGYTDTISYRRG